MTTPHKRLPRGSALNAASHGASSEIVVKRVATVQKRRLLRQIRLRAADLDGLGLGYLDLWARAQAKVELMDAWTAEHGFLTADGQTPPFTPTYFAAVNSARLALSRLHDYLDKKAAPVGTVFDHSQYAPRRVA